MYYLFTTDGNVVEIGIRMMRFLVPTYFTYITIEIFSGALRGVGDCWIPMIMTALGVCALRVVWVLAAVPFRRDILTVVFCYPLTWSVTSILFLIYYHWFSALKRFSIAPAKHKKE